MPVANQSLKFHSEALGENALMVLKLRGEERLAAPFRFELELISIDPELDLDAALYQPAKLGILQRLGPDESAFRWFQGTLCQLEEHEQGQGWTSYRAVLVPDLWRLTEQWRSRVFQGVTTDELVGRVLKESLGLQDGLDFQFDLGRTEVGDRKTRAIYPEREYVVQYLESDLDFIQRWLEHEGIWYRFENQGEREKIVFADSSGAYQPVDPRVGSYPYRPQGRSRSTGAEDGKRDAEDVVQFRCRTVRLPGKVRLDDYNWRDPQVNLKAERLVHKKGTGVQREYNNHYKTPAQGSAHAEVRAQELTCRGSVCWGESTCRAFRPGRTFGLSEHFRPAWNRSYLLTAVVHEAEQTINLEASNVTAADYRNSFECIPAELEFRPERTVRWPAIHGVQHARVDGESDGSAADLDEHGRYKVRIPWDENAEVIADGKASRWIRMAQPYAGPRSGMHFPLLKGTEVLLVHIDGDPDRPIIAGAVPDCDTSSPTNQQNPTQNKLQTPSGNVFLTDDHPDRSGFVFMDSTRSLVQDFRRPVNAGLGESPNGGGGGERRAALSLGPSRTPRPAADRPPPDQARSAVERLIEGSMPVRSAVRAGPAGGHGTDVAGLPLTPPDADAESVWGSGIQEYLDANLDLNVETTPAVTSTDAQGQTVVVTPAKYTHKLRKLIDDAFVKLEGKSSKNLAASYQLEARRFDEFLAISYQDSPGIGEVTIKNCDQYIYIDNTKEYKFGTGGYSYTEQNGDAEVYTVNNGALKTDAKVTGVMHQNFRREDDLHINNYAEGHLTSIDINMGARAMFSYQGDATATAEIRTGATARFSLQVGLLAQISIAGSASAEVNFCAGAKAAVNINLSAEASVTVTLGTKATLEVGAMAGHMKVKVNDSKLITVPRSTQLMLDDTILKLNQVEATLNDANTGLSATRTKLSQVETTANKTVTDLQSTDSKLNDTKTAMNKNLQALMDNRSTINQSDQGILRSIKVLTNSLTAGITLIN